VGVGVSWGVAAVSIQQALIRSLGGEELPPPPILGLVLTSGLYPVLVEGDAVDLGFAFVGANTAIFFDNNDEQVRLACALVGNPVLTATIVYTSYTNWPLEAIDLGFGGLVGNPTLTTTIVYTSYTNWPLESVDLTFGGLVGNPTLTVVIQFLNYTNWPLESVDLAFSFQGATLA
jgi:hypothetical protein